MTNCEKVLSILTDGKPHSNFSIIDSFGGGNFALAARIRNLKEQGYNIKSGTPQEFGKIRQKQGEWWYQLLNAKYYKPEPKQQNFLNPVHQEIIDNITLKPLTSSFMKANSQDIKGILA